LQNPNCYERLEQEIDAVEAEKLKKAGGLLLFPWAVAQTMPYLDACIREAMRLHPVERLPHGRIVPKGGLTICGQYMPEGTEVGIYTPVVHRSRRIFGDDVEIYRPERWLEESSKTERMRSSMFNFSYGRHTCLGQNISRLEVYKLVPSLLRTYKVSSCTRRKDCH
jgi:cytochrome P450